MGWPSLTFAFVAAGLLDLSLVFKIPVVFFIGAKGGGVDIFAITLEVLLFVVALVLAPVVDVDDAEWSTKITSSSSVEFLVVGFGTMVCGLLVVGNRVFLIPENIE